MRFRSHHIAPLIALALLAYPAVAAAAAKPNLAVTKVTPAATTVAAGAKLTVTDTTSNSGGAKAGAFSIRLTLSTNKAVNKSDIKLGTRALRKLAKGAKSTATKAYVVPAATKAGAYFVLVCADAGRAIAERSEGDNCRASGAKVTVGAAQTPGPAPTPGGVPAGPPTKPGITFTRNDAVVQPQVMNAGDLLWERAEWANVTATYYRMWLYSGGQFRLNTLDYNSVSGEICRSALVGTWTFAEGYTFPEGGGGIAFVLNVTINGTTSRELWIVGNAEPTVMYFGANAVRFDQNNYMNQNC